MLKALRAQCYEVNKMINFVSPTVTKPRMLSYSDPYISKV